MIKIYVWTDKSDVLSINFDIARYLTQPKHVTHRTHLTNKSPNHSVLQHRYCFVFCINSLVHNALYFVKKRLLSLAWAAWAAAVFLNGNSNGSVLRATLKSQGRWQEAYLQSIMYWAQHKRFSWYENRNKYDSGKELLLKLTAFSTLQHRMWKTFFVRERILVT